MALFVDLSDDDAEPPQDFQGGKPVWKAGPEGGDGGRPRSTSGSSATAVAKIPGAGPAGGAADEAAQEPEVNPLDDPNRNSMTKALGCYPIIVTIASSLDLDSIDSLSRTCRQVRAGLVQYRKILLRSSLRCVNESVPVDPEETLRYRARAGNWFYMEETGRSGSSYNGKSGLCALDRVSECRRCGTVVCRNCAIKPPAPIVLRDRHRRLCTTCTKVPLTEMVKPTLQPNTPLASDIMQSKICRCAIDGVWLCQPCGRSIRGADHDYKAIWKWRSQYGEVLGGLGTGIGEGDRGVPCGLEEECHGAKDCESETDCDAADAAADDYFLSQQQHATSPPSSPPRTNSHHHHGPNNLHTHHSHHSHHHIHQNHHHHFQHLSPASSHGVGTPTSPDSTPGGGSGGANGIRRLNPSPGYARHEIEGIGGVVKTKLVRMVKVGACVPEWDDERARREILGREVSGRVRSWCGWCWRVVPGQKDIERDHQTGIADTSKSTFTSPSLSSSSMTSSSIVLRGRLEDV